MKNLILSIVSTSILFGCKPEDIKREKLIDNWECIKLNSRPIEEQGFTSIVMEIFENDSLQVKTSMNTSGVITTRSEGVWNVNSNIFKSKLGNHESESNISIPDSNLVFIPDPSFRSGVIKQSEYRRIE